MLRWLQGANRLKVSRDKSVAGGSSGKVAKKLATSVVQAQLKPVSKWKMLGTGVNGGRRRSVAYFRERLQAAKGRVERVRQLRKMGVRTNPMVGVAVTSVQSYG